MLCREANEAHLALLSTLPPHLAGNLGAPVLNPESEQQQIQNERMIREFKTMPCGLEGSMSSHDHRCCPFYHSERDRRRLVSTEDGTNAYSAEPCDEQFDDQRQCSRGDACGMCHSTAELLYHPDFFRKRLCHQAKRCPRGRFCAFAHSRQELLVPHFSELEEIEPTEDFIAWRFKTQWCPIGGPHDWENCVYAHTYRDWRRVPTLGYSSRPCPHWVQSVTTGPAELMYADRCPRGMACPLAHGAKEQLYHPQFYKTSPCSEANCKRGALCAFTHGAHDIRRPRGDDPLPNSVREPILQAVELLGRNQPTFWSPPRYHALEEPPKISQNSKARSRGGSFSSLAGAQHDMQRWFGGSNGISDASLLGTDAPLLPAALPSIPGNGGPSSAEHSPTGYSPYGAASPYQFCQWVPMGSEPSTQLIPPAIGYGQVVEQPIGMPVGYGPWALCSPYMPGVSQQNQGLQPGLQPPYLMTLPPSQALDQANQVLEELSGSSEQDGKAGYDGSHPGADPAGYALDPAEVGGVPALHLPDALHLNGIPHWPLADDEEGRLNTHVGAHRFWYEDYLMRQNTHYLRKGLRTPSSLGSPPLSAAPTEVPSPRPIENESNGSANGFSSDDVRDLQVLEALRDTDGSTLVISDVKELPALLDVDAVPQGHELLEAPVPASPSRVMAA